jgi:succinoglycan biosynthesis transport protein ExoP
MELRRYLRLIRQRFALVIVAILVGVGIGYATTSRTPAYTATSTIYVGSLNINENTAQLYAQAGFNEVVATFAVMIPTPVIAQKAIDKTHISLYAGELAAATSTSVVPGTNLINVSVTALRSRDAIRLANGVSQAFVSQIAHYQGATGTTTSTTAGTTQGQVPNEPAYLFQNATAAVKTSSGLTKKILLGALFGLVISILLILLLDYVDITIKSPDELERRVGLPVLGIIPRFSALRFDRSQTGSY